MITYHDAFAKANHYLDDADLRSSLLYMDALAGLVFLFRSTRISRNWR